MNPEGSNTVSAEPQIAGSPFVGPDRIEMTNAPTAGPGNDNAPSSANPAPVQAQSGGQKAETAEHGKENPAVKKPEDSNLVHFEDKQSFNFALALAWIIALLSIVATLYFWWLNRNLTDVLDDKKEKRTTVVSQLESPGNKEVETEALNFKASVTALSAAKLVRNPMATFLPDFYTKIDKDVKITSLSLASGGALSIAGSTASYRAIADQVMALKSWTSLTDVDLASSSYSTEEGVKSQAAKFTITAKVKQPTTATSTSTSTAPSATSTTTPTSASSTTTGATQ